MDAAAPESDTAALPAVPTHPADDPASLAEAPIHQSDTLALTADAPVLSARLTGRIHGHRRPVPFPPTTLIVGDSIIRNAGFLNVATHCFPGATALVILDKLPGLLNSLPSSIHVGTNDTAHQHSELTKKDFLNLFYFLNKCGKCVFISGPLPTLARGVAHFI